MMFSCRLNVAVVCESAQSLWHAFAAEQPNGAIDLRCESVRVVDVSAGWRAGCEMVSRSHAHRFQLCDRGVPFVWSTCCRRAGCLPRTDVQRLRYGSISARIFLAQAMADANSSSVEISAVRDAVA